MGPELLPLLALTAGGTVLQSQAAQEQADQKRQVLNRQLTRDDQTTDKAIDLTQQEAQKYAPAARLAAMQGQEGQIFDQSQKDIGAGGALVDTAGDNGNVSEDFLKAKADRAVTEGNRLTDIAREAAKTRAPTALEGEEGLSKADLAGSLQSLFGTNRNLAGATENDAAGVQEPGYGLIGKLGSSIGTALLARNLAAKPVGAGGTGGAGTGQVNW